MVKRKVTARIIWSILAMVFLIAGYSRFTHYANRNSPSDETTKVILSSSNETAPAKKKVSVVFDGDTVMLKGGAKVRYLGVDTPEKDEYYYSQATKLNNSMVGGREVSLKICGKRPKDKHGRILARVYVGNTDVTMELIKAGAGRVFDDSDCESPSRRKDLWKAMLAAYKAGKGMWVKAPKSPVDASKVYKHPGRTMMVRGKVTDVYEAANAYWAHFGGDWRTTGFSVRFPKGQPGGYANPKSLSGKTLTVIGEIQKWKKGPFITCYHTEQVELLD